MMQCVTVEEIMEGEADYDSDVLIGVPSIARLVDLWLLAHIRARRRTAA